MLDVTDKPMPTIQAGRPVRIAVEDSRLPEPRAANGKPPYQVPSMSEIAQIPLSGLTAISTFSGCGGSSLGYRMAGFKVLWASEFVDAARACYTANFPDTPVDARDIRQVHPDEILKRIGLARGELDLLDGSPPCASFSTAGKRSRDWGKIKSYSDKSQRTDDLFFEFARILEGLQPRVFVAENVSGLVKGVAKGYFLEILAALRATGYIVRAKVLDAQWLGVPQARQRLIYVGVRKDLGFEPPFPKPMSYRYSLREACPWIVSGSIKHSYTGERREIPADRSPAPTISAQLPWKPETATQGMYLIEAETDISRYAIGRDAETIAEGGKSDKYINLQRAHRDRPVPTITAAGGSSSTAGVVHPTERRKFTIAELKRICAFPDDFQLLGSYATQWERLGRAVPPLMMRAVAEVVRDEVLLRS